MPAGRRVTVAAAVVSAVLVVGAQERGPAQDAELQMQLAALLFEETRFHEALEAYRLASAAEDPAVSMRARLGFVRTALRIGEFEEAERAAAALSASAPDDPEVITAHADALWASGLFDEAERGWRRAVSMEPELSRGRHGLARALASQGRLDLALEEAEAALRLAPDDGEIHHTVGTIYERMRRYAQAAAAYTRYIDLLPNKERSDKAAWSRAQVRFLQSFGEREPLAIDPDSRGRLHTVPFKLEDDKILVPVKVNGGRWTEFVLDTGSEHTTMSPNTARARGVRPITYTLSAGVGEVGLRGLQLGRLDSFEVGTLRVENVPVLIKSPALTNLPKRETESFSPLALGLSMTVDYGTQKLTIAESLPDEPAEFRLPLRMHRLAMVRGLVHGTRPAYFVVDTGGEVISISQATADAIGVQAPRHIALRVYGTSGWDRDAFLLPGVDLQFQDIAYNNFAVVVLNLRAPSVLLGFQVGGIVGHKFLSPYRVAMDLERGEVRMSKTN